MAIISIPTSLSGISIPGNLVDPLRGPLSSLFGNKFGLGNYSYPRDLGSATKQHWVLFEINEIIPSQIDTKKITNFSSEFTNEWNETKKLAELDGLTNLRNVEDATTQEMSTFASRAYTKRQKRLAETISLYMPDTLDVNYSAGYTSIGLTQLAANVAGGLVSKLSPAVGEFIRGLQNNDIARLASQSQGYAINPNLQMIFEGIDFRSYQLTFFFTPYSRQEADQVQKIIKAFKKHAMPRALNGGVGMFFVPPSTFDLKFYFNGSINKKIHKVTESVITNIDVNYTPNGWTTYTDGTPVQIQLTLQFREIDIIDRNKIEAGY